MTVEDLRNSGSGDQAALPDTKPAFSGQGLVFVAESIEVPRIESPIYAQMFYPWTPEYYQVPRSPIEVGQIQDRQTFSGVAPEIVQVISSMPIKRPGMSEYIVPIELQQFSEALQQIINYETAINPVLIQRYFAYLSIHQSMVQAQKTQRLQGAHVDGLQIAIYPNSVPPEQTYIVGDSVPTTFYPGQAVDFTGIEPTTQSYAAALREQSSEDRAIPGEPYVIYFFDSYTPHRTSVATVDTWRTFLRMEFSQRDYQLPDAITGNRPVPNPLFSS